MKKTKIRNYIMTRAWLGIEGRRIQSEFVLRLGGKAPSIRPFTRIERQSKLVTVPITSIELDAIEREHRD